MDHHPDYETIEYHLIYSELIRAARQQRTITYQELSHYLGFMFGGDKMRSKISELLVAIAQNEIEQNRPMLTAVAVTSTGLPDDNFYELAKSSNLMSSRDNKTSFWEKQVKSCYRVWKQKIFMNS